MSRSTSRSVKRTEQQVTASYKEEMIHVGPLPDPKSFAEYNAVLPGAAEKLLNIFEEERQHRHDIEKEQIKLHHRRLDIQQQYADMDSRNSLWGLIFAFVICLVLIGGGLSLAMLCDSPAIGAALSGGGFASIAGVFIYGTRFRVKEKTQTKKE